LEGAGGLRSDLFFGVFVAVGDCDFGVLFELCLVLSDEDAGDVEVLAA
jgi:hypothetical protein